MSDTDLFFLGKLLDLFVQLGATLIGLIIWEYVAERIQAGGIEKNR